MKLVCVHGAGGSSLSYYYVVRHFGGRADAVDLPGHPRGRPCTSVQRYAEWLRGYIWARGYEGVVLMGHSMGGAITQQYALDYPQELKGIVLVGTGARLRVDPAILRLCDDASRDPARYQGWLRQREEGLRGVAPEVREMVVQRSREVGPAVALNDFLCCDVFDVMDRVHQIRLPTLVICGTEDTMTPLRYSDYLASRIPGARKVVVEGATHAVMLERPEVVIREVEAFLASLGG